EDEDIRKIGYDEYRRNKVGFVFQSFNLVPFMTAVENILVAMSITGNKVPSEQKEIAYNLLDFVGIDRVKADRTVNRLSGGEQQRVAIARSISTNVDIILADEPTGNLDEETENEIVGIFKELAHRFNKCVIIVTHSSEIAKQSDQVAKLRKGVLHGDE
nr:ATP-binding cassette domain-containing protein [Clostridia bacterium]